jgi:hypothetical protein
MKKIENTNDLLTNAKYEKIQKAFDKEMSRENKKNV